MASGPVIGSGQILITANTQPAVQAMQQLQGASQKATSSIIQQFGNATKAIQSNQLISQAETMSALFIQLGGNVSRAASLVTSLIRPVATLVTAFGPLGLGIAGSVGQLAIFAGIGVAAARTAQGLASDAAAAADRLEDLGLSVGPQAAGDLAIYAAGTEDLSIAMDRLTVSAGSGLARELGVISEALSTSIPDVAAYASELNAMGDAVIDGVLIPLGLLRDLIRYGESSVYHALTDGSRAAVENAAATREMKEAYLALGMTVEDANVQIEHQQYLDKEAARVAREAAAAERERERAIRQAEQAERERARAAAQALKEEEERHAFVMQTRIEGYRALAEAAQAASDAEIQAILDARIAEAAAYDAQSEEIQAILDARIKAADLAAAHDAATMQAGVSHSIALTGQVLGDIAQIEGNYVSSLQRREAAGESLSKAEVEAGNRAIKAQRDLSIEQAGISATLAGITTYVALTSELVPPPLAAFISAGVASASFAAAVSGINSGTPEFFDYRGNENDGTPNAPYEPYHHNPDDPPGVYGSGGAQHGDVREGGHGAARTRGGRGRREPVVRVEIVRDARGSGKLRR